MDGFAEALLAVKALKADRVVDEYAVGGAMAFAFWSEPTATFDLDVFVLLKSDGMLVSLDPIYRWARGKGYREEAEHIVIMKTESVEDTLATLREGKRELRDLRRKMSLPEKVEQVVELQKIHVATAGRRRPLGALERVWPLRKR